MQSLDVYKFKRISFDISVTPNECNIDIQIGITLTSIPIPEVQRLLKN